MKPFLEAEIAHCYQFRVFWYERSFKLEPQPPAVYWTDVHALDAKRAIDLVKHTKEPYSSHYVFPRVEILMADGTWWELQYFEASDFQLVLYNAGIVNTLERSGSSR